MAEDREKNGEQNEAELSELRDNQANRGMEDWVTEPRIRPAQYFSANAILVNEKPGIIEQVLEIANVDNVSSDYERH